MPYTPNMQALEVELGSLRRSLTATEDAFLDLRDREKRLAAVDSEGDAELAAKYRRDYGVEV